MAIASGLRLTLSCSSLKKPYVVGFTRLFRVQDQTWKGAAWCTWLLFCSSDASLWLDNVSISSLSYCIYSRIFCILSKKIVVNISYILLIGVCNRSSWGYKKLPVQSCWHNCYCYCCVLIVRWDQTCLQILFWEGLQGQIWWREIRLPLLCHIARRTVLAFPKGMPGTLPILPPQLLVWIGNGIYMNKECWIIMFLSLLSNIYLIIKTVC